MLHTEQVTYDVDAVTMVGHLAVDVAVGGDAPRSRPAVLLFHEGAGQDDNVRERANRLAGLGYVAFAADYFGNGGQLPFKQAQARLGELIDDVDATRRLGLGALAVLQAVPLVDPSRIAAIGFCFGGVMALELACTGERLGAVVGFHPGLGTQRTEDLAKITASVLMCCGADDPIIPLETRGRFEQAMREAGVRDWRVELYGGVGHSFTNPQIDERGWDGFAYDERADTRSWRSMLDLLDASLGPVAVS